MFKEIPKSKWPFEPEGLVKVFKTESLSIQEYHEANGQKRLTVHKLKHRNGKWVDGITWDELQHAKRLVGYGNHCAVEIYPPDHSIVNVANMRHLWITEMPEFAWRTE